MTARALLALAAFLPLAACADDPPKGEVVAPVFAGKADVGDRVTLRGDLAFGDDAAVAGAFTEDLMFDAWVLNARPGARLLLEVTQRGSSRGLDTTLYVYGPRTADGDYGASAIAFDDDAGWGLLSRLRDLELVDGGEYLVVVGTATGRGRGDYRLRAVCASDDCAPVEVARACHPDLAAAVHACVADWQQDIDFDPYTMTETELLAQCADVEVVAGAWDALCAGPNAPAELCAYDIEGLGTKVMPACHRELYHELLDTSCVFGDHYRDLWRKPGAVVVVWERTLTSPEGLSALEREQVLEAVRATAYDDVATVEEAFEVVDYGEVNQAELWDASARRAFTVYEVGAGDNSFGAFFDHGQTTVAAQILDGDIGACTATWGPERRQCDGTLTCDEGLRCEGTPWEYPLGRCLDPTRDDHPANGTECLAADACPSGSGLVCAGAATGWGLCLPGWMKGRFVLAPEAAIPDGPTAAGGGLRVPFVVYGLATVSMDVVVDLHISHPRISDLRVTLTNPAETASVLFDGSREGRQLVLRGEVARGFPGDESVNGSWVLEVVDTRAGDVGVLYDFALTLTTRWD